MIRFMLNIWKEYYVDDVVFPIAPHQKGQCQLVPLSLMLSLVTCLKVVPTRSLHFKGVFFLYT